MIGLLAHAAPINYKFPLPIWLYVAAGGAAVLLSAPAAALAVTEGDAIERRGPDVYRFVRRLGPILTVIGVALILVALVGGLFSTTDESQEFFENPVLVLTWVDFWVGLGIVSWLVGNVWERVSPLNVAGRALDRVLARNGVEPLRYPAWLGQWPAVGLLLVWSWMELIWGPAKEPRPFAAILLAYMIATLVGCAVFGAEVWFGERRAVQCLLAHALPLLAARAASVLARGRGRRHRGRSGPRGCAHTAPGFAPIRRCRWAAVRSCSPRSQPSSSTAGRKRIVSEDFSSGSGSGGRSSRITSTCCRRCRWLPSS